MGDLLVVIVLAVAWWVPVFKALTNLQRHQFSISRKLFWKWALILTIPLLGSYLYFRRGRAEVEAEAERLARERKPGRGARRR